MSAYDQYYQNKDYFGAPHPVLIDFFMRQEQKGNILDLGCGQGRNAIPLARMGYELTGVDLSPLGIRQMMDIAKSESLPIEGIIGEMSALHDLRQFDYVLLDSMLHFSKAALENERNLLSQLFNGMATGAWIVLCFQITPQKKRIFEEIIAEQTFSFRSVDRAFTYHFTDPESAHSSSSNYQMSCFRK